MTGESAKVVGYLITWYDTMYRGKTTVSSAPCNKDDGVSEPLVTLTDHEAALADWKLLVEEYKADGVAVQAKWHAAEAKLSTLLTGLEALAGELAATWNMPAWRKDAVVSEIVGRIRTLASAGLEGKTDASP